MDMRLTPRHLTLFASALCLGCGVGGERAERVDRQAVGPEAFASGAAPGGERTEPVSLTVEETPPAPVVPFGGEALTVRSAPPSIVERPEPVALAGLALLEAKVGDINGKPIYISSFFETIEDRLVAEAARLKGNEWRREAAKIVAGRLDGLIADELLRAEALAALTPQQRQGLRSFLTTFRQDLLTENLGSAQLANRRLQETSGQTLDQALQEKETDTLIRLTLFQEINRRVNVSWRDIQQRYERDIADYNPPPTASFRLIRVATADAAAMADITGRLAAGEAFEAVATAESNTFRREDGGLVLAQFEGEFAEGEFFQAPALNEKARALAAGEVVGPFELGDYTGWLKLEAIEQESISLYDAQLRINQELTLERRGLEQQRYLGKLIERARVSNRDEILLRLLGVAEERYGPKG